MDSHNNTGDVDRLVTGFNRLGFRILRALCTRAPEKNAFISPAGIAFSLALIHDGAGGDTRQAIARVLELQNAGQQHINESSLALYESLVSQDPEETLAIASALWIDNEISFDPSFRQIAKRFFKAEAGSIDFGSPAAVETINKWVQQQTRGRITSLVEKSDFDAQTDFVLANAVYFKGGWSVPFNPAETRQGTFHLPQHRRKSTWLMRQANEHGYLEHDAFQAIRLPYSGGALSSYIFLPSPQSSLTDLVKNLEIETWNRWIAEFAPRLIEVILPRFKLSYEVELRESLRQLGMGVAFGSGADFAPMGLPGRYIAKIKHKSMVQVNEEGTEAAATTAVLMSRSLFAPPRISIDRPFFWAILDHKTGLVLFLGAVFDPEN